MPSSAAFCSGPPQSPRSSSTSAVEGTVYFLFLSAASLTSSDVLPWQCLSRYPDACRGVRFVDIDFPDVMAAKKAIVSRTPELQGLLTNLVFPPHPRVLVQSDQYCQIACDLRQLAVLREDLAGLVDTAHAELLFVAEVSITYMEPEAADALIRESGFCMSSS